MQLSQIVIYPIKSFAGLALPHALVTKEGLQYDKQFMLTDFSGQCVTPQTLSQLFLFSHQIIHHDLIVSVPDGQSITITYDDFSLLPEQYERSNNPCFSYIASIKINRWFSHYLQQDVQLRWRGFTAKPLSTFSSPSSLLFDVVDSPFLLINKASLDYATKKCKCPLVRQQFRGNIIIDGLPAFAEDCLKSIKIGKVIFNVINPFSCSLFTAENSCQLATHEHHNSLSELKTYRCNEIGNIDFGMRMIATNTQTIHIGDDVKILETTSAKKYNITEQTASNHTPEYNNTSVNIHYNTVVFNGNKQQTILEQLEYQHITIPFSCRAGICGQCQIELVSGKVEPLRKGAIKKGNKILACSCLPKGNIKIRK